MSSGTQPDSPVGGDGVEMGAGSAAPDLTGSFPPGADSESGHDGSGELRASESWSAVEALAALLEPEAFDDSAAWKSDVTREEYRARARHHAAKAITSGYLPAPAPGAELVALIAGAPCVWSTPIRMDAQTIAEVITAAGFRRVSEDDDTIERVARKLAAVLQPSWDPLSEHMKEAYRRQARAAVQALRDGGEA